MKKWMFLLMTLTLLTLTACGGGGEGENKPAPEESKQPATEQPAQPEPEKAPVAEKEKKETVLPLRLMQGTEGLSEWDDNYHDLCTATWEALALRANDAKNWPKLAAVLENLNREQYEDAAVFMQEWLPIAKEMDPEYFGGFTNTVEYSVQRVDSRILSIREDWDNYTGGVHPNYGAFGINFDTAAGEPLDLDDVLTDVDMLYPLLAKTLEEKYAEELYDDPTELLKGYAPESLNWTVNYQGITFYFSPYDIAPYAAGLLTATIWFDEEPELFRPEYTTAPADGWAMALPDWSAVEFDRKAGDGQRDMLSLNTYENEYGSKQLLMILNGAEYQEEGWTAFDITAYLVCAGEKFYLYVEGRGENDYRTMYIYDLNGTVPKLVSEFSGAGFIGHWDENAGIDGVYYYDVMTAITDFTLGSKCNLLGTKTAVRQYNVNGEDGSLQPLAEEYGFIGELEPIVSAVPLEVTVLPGSKETLPAGTEFSFLRTDNESYVVLELADGRACRIDIVEIDWTPTINGVPEWECFEDLMYAG